MRGVGAQWVRQIDRTYDVGKLRDTLREALTTKAEGPKIIVASSECMLNKQRRVRPILNKAIKTGQRVVREKFGVDEDICTGDHACIRLSGCPSLSVKQTDDPLRDDPVAAIDESCVGTWTIAARSRRRRPCALVLSRGGSSQSDGLGPPHRRSSRGSDRLVRSAQKARPGSPRRRSGVSSDIATRAPGRSSERISLAILAMGGQGGGVLADWIVWLAEFKDWQRSRLPCPASRNAPAQPSITSKWRRSRMARSRCSRSCRRREISTW